MGEIEHVAIIGGDRRQIQLVNMMEKCVDQISVVGFDQQTFPAANVTTCKLSEVPWKRLTAILFPVSGVDQDGTVESSCEETLKVTQEMLTSRATGCKIFTGIMTDFLRNPQVIRDVVCWMERDDVAIYNSVPTAEGVLMLAMQNTPHTIHRAVCTVLGFGRCGLTIAHLLKAVGATVTVITDDEVEKARAHQEGHLVAGLHQMEIPLSKADICINTIPAPVIMGNILQKIKKACYILDIASAPGGVDVERAKQLGFAAEKAPGLPAKVAPETAGEILAQVTLAVLNSEIKKGR
ncbi:dipicolinate synthase subunit A [Geomicrobium halophilum]|uniref:Dipicolinate synthase subunit A n=1 Tax=Geomicrobium halophilum TaxID=549000 RepID=A0A841Q0X0_9BACL|nr:dipicolinate synthase subunit A [Geomicrobium halophilum]